MLNEAMALLQGHSRGSIENKAKKAVAPVEQRSKPVVLPDSMAALEDFERLTSRSAPAANSSRRSKGSPRARPDTPPRSAGFMVLSTTTRTAAIWIAMPYDSGPASRHWNSPILEGQDSAARHRPAPGNTLNHPASDWSRPGRYDKAGGMPIGYGRAENAILPFVINSRSCLFSNTSIPSHDSLRSVGCQLKFTLGRRCYSGPLRA